MLIVSAFHVAKDIKSLPIEEKLQLLDESIAKTDLSSKALSRNLLDCKCKLLAAQERYDEAIECLKTLLPLSKSLSEQSLQFWHQQGSTESKENLEKSILLELRA